MPEAKPQQVKPPQPRTLLDRVPRPPVFATLAEERRHRKERLAASFRLFSRYGFDEGGAKVVVSEWKNLHLRQAVELSLSVIRVERFGASGKKRDPIERAVRELIQGGLLFRCSGAVLPTRAALRAYELLVGAA